MDKGIDNVILELLGILQQLTEDRGVPAGDKLIDKNILPSDNSPLSSKQPPATLTPREKKRLTDSATIFTKVFFDYKKKVDSEGAGKTLISSISDKQKKSESPTKEKKSGLGMWGMLSKMVGLGEILLGLAGLAALVFGIYTDGPLKGIM